MSVETPLIVVVGDGATAWLAARSLASALGSNGPGVTVIAPSDRPPATGAVALRPHTETWHPALELDDIQVVNRALGSFSFGAALTGWFRPGDTWFQPFSTFGAPIGPVPFYPIALRLREAGADLRLANYSLAALAAQTNRFQRPDKAPRSVLSTCSYGMHASRAGLRDLLREQALASGAVELEGSIAEVERDDSGHVTRLRLDEDRSLRPTLLIDATDAHSDIGGRLVERRWEDWSRWLPARREVRALHRTLGTPPPYRHLECVDGGWIEHLPLHGATQTRAWDDGECTEADWLARLTAAAGTDAFAHLTVKTVRAGRVSAPWTGNCIALGEAATTLEPLGGDGFHFARTALQRLLRLLPGDRDQAAVRDEYNRQVSQELDHARDFAIAHHHLAGGGPTDDTAALPDTLAHRLGVFAARGTVPLGDEEPCEPETWIALFDAAGIVPRHAGPLVAGLDIKTLAEHTDKVRAFMLGALKTLPSHEDTLMSLHVADGELESTIESVILAPPDSGPAPPGGP